MKKSKKYKKVYRYPLKMDKEYQRPLVEIAEEDNDTINDVIVTAIHHYLKSREKGVVIYVPK